MFRRHARDIPAGHLRFNHEPKPMDECGFVLEPSSKRQRPIARVYCPRRVTEGRIELRGNRQSADRRIVSKIVEAMMGVTLLVIECQSRIDMLDGIGQGTPPPTHRPRGMVRLEQHLRAIQFACDSEEIVRNLFRSVEAAIGVMEQPKIRDGRRKFLRALEPASNLCGAFDDLADFSCRPAMNAHQGGCEL